MVSLSNERKALVEDFLSIIQLEVEKEVEALIASILIHLELKEIIDLCSKFYFYSISFTMFNRIKKSKFPFYLQIVRFVHFPSPQIGERRNQRN